MVKVTQFVVGDMSGAIAEYLLLSVDIDGKLYHSDKTKIKEKWENGKIVEVNVNGKDYKVDSFKFFDTDY